MPDQDRFGDHGAETSGLRQPHQSEDQMKQKNEEVAHPDNRSKAANRLISRQLWNSPCTRSSAEYRLPHRLFLLRAINRALGHHDCSPTGALLC